MSGTTCSVGGAILSLLILGASHVTAAPPNSEVRTLEQLVNRHRIAIGCRRLVWDERLAKVAQAHSEAMARRGFFDHVDPQGRDPFDRMQRAGISFLAAGENIAVGPSTAREVLAGWMRSRGHRENIENCSYTHHGIGLYRNHWTHVFARY
jgi:uncharacterized protein YkwD